MYDIPVADPGFSPGGGANSQKCYYFSIFCPKLHENERIWTPRGGGASLAPPLGSANAYSFHNKKITFFSYNLFQVFTTCKIFFRCSYLTLFFHKGKKWLKLQKPKIHQGVSNGHGFVTWFILANSS